ncbi:MAG: ABC transporter substrate-binding protein [Vulcanimicrobiota bacterium]
MKHWFLALCVVVIFCISSVGCSKTTSAQKQGEPLKVGLISPPKSLNPLTVKEQSAHEVIDILYRGLIDWNEKWVMIPQVAESIPSVAKGTVKKRGRASLYTEFRIDETARWSNGVYVEANDFLFFYQLAMFPGIQDLTYDWVRLIDRMGSSGEDKMEVSFRTLDIGSLSYLKPLPRAQLEESIYKNARLYFAEPIKLREVVNGPYEIKDGKVKNERLMSLTLVKNTEFFKKKPSIPGFNFKFFLTREALQSDMFAGNFDVMPSITFEEGLNLEKNSAFNVFFTPGSPLDALYFNVESPLLSDIKVRKALLHALNREDIVARIYEKKGHAAASWLPEQHPAFKPSFGDMDYNEKTSIELLKEAGWMKSEGGWKKGDETLTLSLYYIDDQQYETVAKALKEYWERIGVTVKEEKVLPQDFHSKLIEKAGKKEYPSVVIATVDVPPWVNMVTLFGEQSIPASKGGGLIQNFSRWSSERNRDLCTKFSHEIDIDRKNQLLAEHQALLAEELPLMPLYFRLKVCAVRKGIQNVAPRGFGSMMWNVEHWTRESK